MENQDPLALLFKKYLDQQYTEQDLDRLLHYFQLTEHDEELLHLIVQELEISSSRTDDQLVKSIGDRIAISLFEKTNPRKKYKLPQWLPYAAAVLILGLVGLGFIYLYQSEARHPIGNVSMATNNILPGGNRATIRLDNGRLFSLSEEQEGVINTGNRIIYTDGSAVGGLQATHTITLTTPRAGQYTVTLSDGTKVWLNAASELQYPTQFGERERIVRVVGEAYFEVAHDEKKPFIVETDKQSIRVLGTRFNVHAYTDESQQHTTLVQGAVAVKDVKGFEVYRLKPGQQILIKPDNHISILRVDPQEYISWKDGIIMLNSYDLPEILTQLERWYDVNFDDLPIEASTERVFGMIRRDVPFNDVLQTLRDNYTNIQFKLNGRRVMISRQ